MLFKREIYAVPGNMPESYYTSNGFEKNKKYRVKKYINAKRR